MTFRRLMIFTAGFALLMGAGLLAVPSLIGDMYGLELDAAGVMVGRLLGAEVFGFALVSWFVRNERSRRVQIAVLGAFAVTDTLGALAVLPAVLDGTTSAAGWELVGALGALAIAYAWGAVRSYRAAHSQGGPAD